MKPTVLYTARVLDGALLSVTPAVRETLGFDPRLCTADVLWWASRVHPDDRPAAVAARRRALEKGHADAEYRLRLDDGSFALIHDEIARLDAPGPPLLHGAWTRFEVDEDSSSNSSRAGVSEELRLLFELTSVGNAFLKLDGRLVRTNEAFRRFLGREAEDVVGASIFDLLHPDDIQEFRDQLATLHSGERPHMRFETRFARMGGWVVWADASVVLLRDALGAPRELLLHAIDVTDQRLALELLRVNEKRLATALANAQHGLWDWDLATDTVYLSPVWKSTLGYREDELEHTAQTFWGLVHPDDAEAAQAQVRDYIAGNADRYEARFRLRHKAGHYVMVLARGTLLRDEDSGAPMHFVGTHMDLTELDRRETVLREARDAAEAANRAKSTFLANMSHELRTPLNSIIGFSELLMQEPADLLDERQRGYAQSIHESGKNLLAVLNDIIEIASIEAGRVPLRLERAPLAVVIDATRGAFERLARRAGVTLTFELTPGLPELSIDVLRMKQVLSNLLSNAIKFTPRGGRVTVATRSGERHVALEVADTGIGIKEEDRARLFQDFEQLETGRGRNKEQGTGLGLALARRLVEMHGGAIAVTSEPGHGSVFTVRLPIPAS